MKVIDLTHIISAGMPVYPGTEGPKISQATTIEAEGFAEKLITMYSHTGTHMDAPGHIVAGARTLDQFETGLVSFHHHVHQRHGDVWVLAQQVAGLLRAVGMQQMQGTFKDAQVVQDEAGDAVDLRVVIDDEQLPRRGAGGFGSLGRLGVSPLKQVVGHVGGSKAGRSGALRGRIKVKVVPAWGMLWT